MPPTLSRGGVPESPAPTTHFQGPTGFETVPDTFGAVGTNHVLTMLNTCVAIQSRDGAIVWSNTLKAFWTSTNIASSDIFDPRVVYDPFHHRWIATAAADLRETTAGILIGVSRTSNPTNIGDAGWNLRQIKADTNSFYWADQPTVGFNKDWIVVQANMSGLVNGTGTNRSYIWVFNKTNLYGGNLGAYKVFVHADPSPGISVSFSEVPAVTYDNSLTNLYLLQSANGNTNIVGGTNNSGYLRLFSISGPIGSEVLNNVEETNAVYIQATNAPWSHSALTFHCGFSPESNGPALGTLVDSRVNNVVYRNGSLWCAQTIFLPATAPVSRSAVQWWQIKPETKEVLQRGLIDDWNNVNFYAFGSIAVNRFNDVLVGYTSFSTNQFPSAGYSFRAFDDLLSTMSSSRNYRAGLTNYLNPGYVTLEATHCRWGDYSMSCVDPLDDAALWTVQEFSVSNEVYVIFQDEVFLSYTRGHWGTHWAQLNVAIPTNDHFNAAIAISGIQGSTNGTSVRATKETGEPSHADLPNTVSVWYRWTAPANGDVVFNLNGDFNTALAIYTGSALTNLVLVASNAGGLNGSQVVLAATSSTVYQIAVDGFGLSPNNQNEFVLSWNQPAAPVFVLHPRNWDTYLGSNITFTAQAIGSPNPGYQWRSNTVNIANATNASYAKLNVQTNDTGNYLVVATNSYGASTSAVAHLEVYSTQRALITEASHSTNLYMRFLVSGITGAQYVVEASTNLVNWSPIYTNITTFTNYDYLVTNFPYRFYRVRYVP